jgi:hypothetical protein
MNFRHSPLNEDVYMMFAMKAYTNPQCKNIDEFYEDLNRIKYIKRLFGKYEKQGEIKEQLIINHIIIMGNVFGNNACCRILFYKIEPKYHSYLKTFLQFLKYLPPTIPEIKLNQIPIDHKITKVLKKYND